VIVVWRVTQHCNLRCPFCEWDRSLPRARQHADATEVLRLAALMSRWQAATGQPVLLSWLGGEPLLWPALTDVAAQVHALGLQQSSTTNGTSLGQARMQQLILQYFTELTVSVDGFADFHDPMRGWPGGFERLRDAVQSLHAQRASREALKLRANVVLMRQNVAAFPALCEELSGWGVDEITFNALGGRDRPEFHPGHALQPPHLAGLQAELPALRARLAARGTQLCGDAAYLHRLAASARSEAIAIRDCRPGREFLFIDERGMVAPCDFTSAGYGVPTATLQTVDDLLALPARFAARQREARASACDDCRSTRVFAKFAA
jgi:MoaA/NifB/PqqE/SkfB family radical SAM enzyme